MMINKSLGIVVSDDGRKCVNLHIKRHNKFENKATGYFYVVDTYVLALARHGVVKNLIRRDQIDFKDSK